MENIPSGMFFSNTRVQEKLFFRSEVIQLLLSPNKILFKYVVTFLILTCSMSVINQNNMQTIDIQPTIKNSYTLLKFTYGLVPIVAGLDKFTNLLTQWDAYLPSSIVSTLPFSPFIAMAIIGIIEIAAGAIVLFKPQIGAYIVAAWLIVIALGLLSGGKFDIAVRDIVMAIGAYVLAKLSSVVS